MGDMQTLFNVSKNLMETPVTIYGFTFNFWQVFLFSLVADLVLWFVFKCFDD